MDQITRSGSCFAEERISSAELPRSSCMGRRMERDNSFSAAASWKSLFPGAVTAALVMRAVDNPKESPALEARKRELEHALRSGGSIGSQAGSDALLRAYDSYYRTFGKTYHVKGQRESVALKGKSIPSRAALVEAMFMAELKNLILTAGHDLAAVRLPVTVGVTGEGDRYVVLSGRETAVRAGDMMMTDGEGIISSVLYGPDLRTHITSATRSVFFAAYAPPGIGEAAVRDHLEDIRANVLLFAPEAETDLLTVIQA
jgi:DNA/RNA-binding domain of Phe-tRNA-synthetase-like protein